MAGLTNKLFEHLNRDWEARRQIMESQLHKDQEKSLAVTLKFLRKHAGERDVHSLLDDERVMIRHALKFDANSPEETQSLKTATLQLEEAAKGLDVVCNDPQGEGDPTCFSHFMVCFEALVCWLMERIARAFHRES